MFAFVAKFGLDSTSVSSRDSWDVKIYGLITFSAIGHIEVKLIAICLLVFCIVNLLKR